MAMPYIKSEARPKLDGLVERLAAEIKAIAAQEESETAFAGLLNYACTRLLLQVLPARRYWAIALATGVMHNVLDEFYRRYGVPYEEEQIAKNGDVYPEPPPLGRQGA
jgi:hypothetical protein